MTTADPFETIFQQTLERANRVAGYLLRSHLGAHTSEDVVSALIEKELRNGKSLFEIEKTLSGPGMYRRLANAKNDIFRWESAAKRGSGQPSMPFEDAEPFMGTDAENPEKDLIEKEDSADMKNLLNLLIEKVELSETQKEILNLDRRGYSNQRIAHELGIDVAAVYARRSEALRKLATAARHFSRDQK